MNFEKALAMTQARTRRVIRASWEKLMVTPELVSDLDSCAGLICNLRHLAQHEGWAWKEVIKLSEEYFEAEDRSRTFLTPIGLIKQTVADYYGLEREVMAGRARHEAAAWARQVAMTLCYEMLPETLVSVGFAFGKRHHGTVLHAQATVRDRCSCYPNIRTEVDSLTSAIKTLLDQREAP